MADDGDAGRRRGGRRRGPTTTDDSAAPSSPAPAAENLANKYMSQQDSSPATQGADAKMWAPDAEEGFLVADVLGRQGDNVEVQFENGSVCWIFVTTNVFFKETYCQV